MADETVICYTAIPGPPGPPGTPGTDGTDGLNAYTTSTGSFVMPAEGENTTVNVVSSEFASVGQILYIQVGGAKGYFEVTGKPSETSLQIKNLKNTSIGAYLINSPPGTTFTTLAEVNPGGLQGPQGSAAASGATSLASYLLITSNGSLPNSQSLSGLGNGLMYTTRGTGVSIARQGIDFYAPTSVANPNPTDVSIQDGGTGASTTTQARINLGLVIGTNVQAYDAGLQSLSAFPTVANRIAYSTAPNVWAETTLTPFMRNLLDDADLSSAQSTLGIVTTNALAMLLYQHQTGSGVDSGPFSSGDWRTVELNTEVVDTGANGSIVGNVITLTAGTYRYVYGVVACQVGSYRGRLFNLNTGQMVPDSYSVTTFCVEQAGSGEYNNVSYGRGRFELFASTSITLQARCFTSAIIGFGAASNTPDDPDPPREIYSWLELFKE